MLATIERELFETADPRTLVWASIEPAIREMWGKDVVGKSEIAAQLTLGQQALVLFRVLYDHSRHGIAEFYQLVPHLPRNDVIWTALQSGIREFGDEAMGQILAEMEAQWQLLAAQHADNAAANWTRLLAEHEEAVARLDRLFQAEAPAAIAYIAAYIRQHPARFVQIAE